MHSYDESVLVATVDRPSVGEWWTVAGNFSVFNKVSHISLVYNGTDNDAWRVSSVDVYKKGGWSSMMAPDVVEAGGVAAAVDMSHIDSEWFDTHPGKVANTIKTLWITATEQFAETTNLITVYFHSEEEVHYAGVIYDPLVGSAWIIESHTCPFPVENLTKVTARALRAHTDDGYIVEKVELMVNGRYEKMWGETWNADGGWIAHHQPSWMPDPLDEVVLVRRRETEPPATNATLAPETDSPIPAAPNTPIMDTSDDGSDDWNATNATTPAEQQAAADAGGDSRSTFWGLLITGIVLVVCALCVVGAYYIMRNRQGKPNMKSIIFDDDDFDDDVELNGSAYEGTSDDDCEEPLRKSSGLVRKASNSGAELKETPSTYEPPAIAEEKGDTTAGPNPDAKTSPVKASPSTKV
ncbi:hypothetical protein DIPPA_16684 [Diplonema papillatum]|nr:hypothetical protein DIPPA_16684 [Diplonema papillatum]